MASKSPRRKELLGKIGITKFKIIEADIDETTSPDIPPSQAACDVALGKAREVASKVDTDDVIIAADTIVLFDQNKLGKPSDESEAFAMLNMLSGMWHEVITGVAIIKDGVEYVEYETTRVKFREIEPWEIEQYINSGEPMDKAGAYGVQELGSLFVERIEGDFYNVMGLPLFRLGKMLEAVGVHLLSEE